MRAQLAASYLLHRRSFRDNSELLEVFTMDYGRVALIARGTSRRRRGGALASLLQPFRPLLLSFSGRGEMMSLGAAEVAGELMPLRGEALLSGFYLNELLLRMLQRFEANPELFSAYATALGELSQAAAIEPTLRRFEFGLLEQLGYAIDLRRDALHGRPLNEEHYYLLDHERGFLSRGTSPGSRENLFPGNELILLGQGHFDRCAATAKRVSRLLLRPYLGDAPLVSRRLFASRRTAAGEAG
jgi:DNA repair protein RecO (recombination protein O)